MNPPRALLLLWIALAPACAWTRDRAADLSDVVVFEASAGTGLSADVKATDLAHVGAGYAEVRKLSYRDRRLDSFDDREVGLPPSLLLTAGAMNDGEVWRAGHLHANASEAWYAESDMRLTDVEVGAVAGFLGLRLGLSPGQLLDFAAGLVGLDPAGDDAGPTPEPLDGPVEAGVWLAGDLHDHCWPPDGPHAPITPEETRRLAADRGLDFLGINPHLWVRGIPPKERPEIVAFAERVRAMDDDGPIVIPGFEVMVLDRWWGAGRSGPGPVPFLARGHALLLFREMDDAFAFEGDAANEAEWVRERLATLPPDRRLWAPTHPWPHPRLKIPFFRDHGAAWRQIEERSTGEVVLDGRRYERVATPWRIEERRGSGDVTTRLVRYRLGAAALAALPDWPPGGGHAEPAPGPTPPALLEALARERRGIPTDADPAELEVAIDAARNGWISARILVHGGTPDGPPAITWAATRPGPDGRPRPALHDVPIDGAECLTGMLHIASRTIGRHGDDLDRNRLFPLLERRMLAERRRIVPLAGSDNHHEFLFPTIWVFAREHSRGAIFDALREGRVCLGSPEATSLRVRTDRDPVWRAVGAAPPADRRVELRWDGTAELIVDGRSLGRIRDGYVHDLPEPGGFHLYRIVKGRSWSGWIHVNLPR